MSDSEEDYMSDKLLLGSEKEDVRPGLLFNKSQKRSLEMYKKQQEDQLKKPKTYTVQERETRDKGLGTAIDPSNKGFKLLEKMGYKSGTGLGKTYSGIVEPVEIKLKSGHGGVGRENHIHNIVKHKKLIKETGLQSKVNEYQLSKAAQSNSLKLNKDYYKAQRICENLDFEHNVRLPEKPHFWSKKARAALKDKTKEEDEEEDTDDDEDVDDITEETLSDIIVYLRNRYRYCMYCGDFVNDEDDPSFCPGLFRTDHDE